MRPSRRLIPFSYYKRNQTLATYVTFIVSAFWHGFFFIYYFFFLEWALFNQVTKYFYKARHRFALYFHSTS